MIGKKLSEEENHAGIWKKKSPEFLAVHKNEEHEEMNTLQ